jgi:hypothetical protein
MLKTYPYAFDPRKGVRRPLADGTTLLMSLNGGVWELWYSDSLDTVTRGSFRHCAERSRRISTRVADLLGVTA